MAHTDERVSEWSSAVQWSYVHSSHIPFVLVRAEAETEVREGLLVASLFLVGPVLEYVVQYIIACVISSFFQVPLMAPR